MKTNKLLLPIGILLTLFWTACFDDPFSDDSFRVQEGLPANISINFKSQENTVVTRAERNPEYENRVDNIYMFIFDSQGNVHYRKLFKDGTGLSYDKDVTDKSKGSLTIETKSLNNAKIVGIANVSVEGVTSTAYTITEADLNKITSYSELEGKMMSMSDNSVERYAIFMMTGVGVDKAGNTEITIPGNESDSASIDCSIKLQRTDAKVKFVVTTDNVHGYENFSFSPRSWVVKRVPSQSYILPQTTGDYDGEDALYFTDMVRPFETITRNETDPKLYTGGSFVFYMPENRKSPKKEITRSGSESDAELYALREKSDGKDDKGDKKFIYASDNSTYVEITGLLSYIDNEKNTNADVRFIVHLGNPEEKKDGSYDVNNYNTNRNTYYTYNIKIRGVNDIKVEATSETGEEPRPGYEGDVVDTEIQAFVFDSHYDRCLIKIDPGKIPQEGNIYWSVNTPFSRGMHVIGEEIPQEMRDYRWIKFAVNAEYGVPEDQFVKYPGDQNYNDPHPFEGQENNAVSPYYKRGGEGHSSGKSAVLGRPYDSENARLMDINQLMAYLRELGKIKEDWGEGITITVFVDEHLYFKHPITGEQTGRSLWKLTSDKEDRILYLIVTDPRYSADKNSSTVTAQYSFRQRTIRTIFDVDNPNLETAWGLESVMETGRLGKGDVSLGSSTRNGRENCLKWLCNKGLLKWTDIVDVSGDQYALKDGYNNAAYACLLRNRDLNGNNIVDPNEVRWYLASIDQLTDIYLGELALDEVSRLYPSNPADRNNQTRWHYTSSSANDQNNSWILWAEEGASRGGSSGSIMDNGSQNTKFSYRCVRNLGISLDNPAEVPKDLVQVISESDGNILIDMSFMNAKARRSSYVTELPSHNEREDANRPYAKFRVHKDAFGSNQPWYFYQTNDPSPTGYRIPNQRELLIMTSRLSSSQWPSGKNQYISQTAFSMYNTGIYRDYTTDGTTIMREGFLWHTNGNFYLQNNRGETGWVRPVQDVR